MSDIEALRRNDEISAGLVVPMYRRFCQELRLNFHFADTLPPGSVPTETLRAEFHLHSRAMSLFNHLRPEIVLFGDSAVRFHFTDEGGGFAYADTPLEEFITAASDKETDCGRLQKRVQVLAGLLGVAAAVLALWGTTFLPPSLRDGRVDWLISLIVLAASVWLSSRLARVGPTRRQRHRLRDVQEKLATLRAEIDGVRAGAPPPFDERDAKRLGLLPLEEVLQQHNPHDFQNMVVELQKHLRNHVSRRRSE